MTSVVTFDQIIPSISEILAKHGEIVGGLDWWLTGILTEGFGLCFLRRPV